MPTSTPAFEALTKTAKDAFYLTVGLGSVAFEQLKSNQSELRSWFETQVSDGKSQFETQASQIEARVEDLLESVQSKLPEQAAELMKQARDAAKSARDQVKDFVTRATPAQGAAA
jgi:ElaB/YqjD/DUF883 family membrane-anchored ribosome-binding protein